MPAPVSYQIFLWRAKFKIGYFEALMTPFQSIASDMEIMALEEEYGEKKTEEPVNKKGLTHGSVN